MDAWLGAGVVLGGDGVCVVLTLVFIQGGDCIVRETSVFVWQPDEVVIVCRSIESM